MVTNLFQYKNIKLMESQKQKRGTDCGLLAIATANAIAHQADVDKQKFDQALIHSYLSKCFREEVLTVFLTLYGQNILLGIIILLFIITVAMEIMLPGEVRT